MKTTALVTGASSGIGKEFAHIHAERGGDLIIVARREEKLQAIKSSLEAQHKIAVHVIAKDLTQPNACKGIFDEVTQKGLQVDYLINNAGFGGRGKFHERDWDKDHAMIQLNIVALTELTRLFLPSMVTRNAGKILNVSSTASLLPGPLQAVYFATKAYVTSFSNAISEELSDTKITVTALLPGATETEFAQTSDMDKTNLFKKAVTARSVAEDGYNAMLTGKLNIISGLQPMQRFMMASIPFTPKKLLLKQIRQMQEVS
ncbi:MAG: SDR family oxidoreductase [Saprospiraceae bacterium]|nr:SDR family oxidoreductase [Saprospiraceae bacterium]